MSIESQEDFLSPIRLKREYLLELFGENVIKVKSGKRKKKIIFQKLLFSYLLFRLFFYFKALEYKNISL